MKLTHMGETRSIKQIVSLEIFKFNLLKTFFVNFQSKQKHHARSHSIIKKRKVESHETVRVTPKEPSSYLIPKFHPATEKSSADNHSVTTVDVHLSSTLNPVYEYSEEINAQAEKDFNERRQHLWKVCERSKALKDLSPNAWEFFISPGHGLAWCNVFKAASTTWMYYFNILGKKTCNQSHEKLST